MAKVKTTFYRGESKDYGETACLATIFRWADEEVYAFESKYYREIFSECEDWPSIQAIKNKSAGVKFLKKLGILQHYGYHTRLLDITSNKDIATYFAACEDFDEDGRIYRFDQEHYETYSQDCIEKLEKRRQVIEEYDRYKKKDCLQELKRNNGMKKRPSPNSIEADAICEYEKIGLKVKNLRYIRQDGAFLLSGSKLGDRSILRYAKNKVPENPSLIKKEDKLDLLFALAGNNINFVKLYPDKEKSIELISEYKKLMAMELEQRNNRYGELIGNKKYDVRLPADVLMTHKDRILANEDIFYFVFKELIDYLGFWQKMGEPDFPQQFQKIEQLFAEENKDIMIS